MWLPDANVAINHAADAVWNGLRAEALGSPIGSTVITGVVEYEIKDWLNDPSRNKERADAIREAMNAGTWVRRF